MVGVKNLTRKKKDERSSGTAIILFTMHAHDGVTSTFLISSMQQQAGGSEATLWQWRANELKATAFNAFLTIRILFQMLSSSNTVFAHNQVNILKTDV